MKKKKQKQTKRKQQPKFHLDRPESKIQDYG